LSTHRRTTANTSVAMTLCLFLTGFDASVFGFAAARGALHSPSVSAACLVAALAIAAVAAIAVGRTAGRLASPSAALFLLASGAAVGVAVTGLVLLEVLGLTLTLWIAAAALLSAGGVWLFLLMRSMQFMRSTRETQSSMEPARVSSAIERARLWILASLSGFAAMVFQRLAVRLILRILPDTMYSVSAVVSVSLLGLAAGAGLVSLVATKERGPSVLRPLIALAAAGAAIAVLVPVTTWLGDIDPARLRELGTPFGVACVVLPAMVAAGAAIALQFGPRTESARGATAVPVMAGVALGASLGVTVLAPSLAALPLQSGYSPADGPEKARQSLVAAALHPAPRTALVLGPTGLARVLLDVGVAVVHVAGDSGEEVSGERAGIEVFDDQPVHFLNNVHAEYDLIIADGFAPWPSCPGDLYSVEHFRAARSRLRDHGLFCQWVPLAQLRWPEFLLIAQSFTRVFPQTFLFQAEPLSSQPMVLLVGSVEPLRWEVDRFSQRLTNGRAAAVFAAAGLIDTGSVLDLYLGDRYTLEAYLDGRSDPDIVAVRGRVNTQDRPIVEFRAARTTETEPVLGINNRHELLAFNDIPARYLEFPDSEEWDEERKQDYQLSLRRRASATIQFRKGNYWRLRGGLPGEDGLAFEDFEAEAYLAGLAFDPDHRLLNDACAFLALRQFQDQRYSTLMTFAAQVASVNPRNGRMARDAGLAALLLGEDAGAVGALRHARDILPDDPYVLTLLAVAEYLMGEDEAARSTLDQLRSAAAGQLPSGLTEAVAAALDGDADLARARLDPLEDHQRWGVLARRIRERAAP